MSPLSSNAPPPQQRRRLVGVSTKMYFSARRTREYIDALIRIVASAPAAQRRAIASRCDVFVIPDHLTLAGVVAQLESRVTSSSPYPSSATTTTTNTSPAGAEQAKQPKGGQEEGAGDKLTILPGAQDTHHADSGAFTGEVSPVVLAEIGCRIVELGHAERRRLFGETDETAALKAAAVARNGMIPLVCIGEVTRPAYMDRSAGAGTGNVDMVSPDDLRAAAEKAALECAPQIESVLAAVPADAAAAATADLVILAYEPVWAIGAAEPASARHVVEVTRCIRRMECVRRRPPGSVRILYGGSAGPGLFERVAASYGRGISSLGGEEGKEEEEEGGGVDGLFLGRFAHDPDMFWKTILEVAGV